MIKELKFNLDKVWSGVYSEVYEDKQESIGKILTIIDAVIVGKEQNKSVKDLIRKSIWEEFERRTNRIREWFWWFNDNSDDKQPTFSSIPYHYDGEDRNPSLNNYKK